MLLQTNDTMIRLIHYLVFILLLASACTTPRLRGAYRGEVPAWLLGGGEYPVTYYTFSRGKRFDYRVIFCMLTDCGSGRYKIDGDEIRLIFGRQKLQGIPPEWDISDTTIVLKFKRLNDSTLLIDDTKFMRYR